MDPLEVALRRQDDRRAAVLMDEMNEPVPYCAPCGLCQNCDRNDPPPEEECA